MSTDDDDLDLDDDDPDLVKKLRSQLRSQSKQVKAAEAAAAERDQAMRELALLKAGVPDTGPGKLFAKAYDGPLEVDEIRKMAVEYGVLDDTGPSNQDFAAHSRMEAAATGAAPASAGPDIAKELAEAVAGGNRDTGPKRIMEVLNKYGLNRLDISRIDRPTV